MNTAPRFLIVRFLVLALTVGSALPLRAQDTQELISADFTCLAWNADVRKETIYYTGSGGEQQIETFVRTRSPEYRYTGPPVVTFYAKEVGPDGLEIRRPVARTRLQDTGGPYLLLFVPQPGAPLPFRIVAIADDVDDFPAGAYRVFNLTGEPIIAKINEELERLDHGQQATFHGDEGRKNIEFALGVKRDGSWKGSYQSAWNFHPQLRHIVFVTKVTEYGNERFDFKIIRQAVETTGERE